MERLPTMPYNAVFRQMLMQKEVARDSRQKPFLLSALWIR